MLSCVNPYKGTENERGPDDDLRPHFCSVRNFNYDDYLDWIRIGVILLWLT
jgi:hypothetical protein